MTLVRRCETEGDELDPTQGSTGDPVRVTEAGRTTLESFTSTHLPLLAQWLGRPHVARWFGSPAEHLAYAAHLPTGASQALITCASKPIGYVRWRHVSREILDSIGLMDIPENAVDLDLFVGEAEYLGRGIGTAALGEILEKLRWDPRVPLVGATTSIANLRARRAFEKVGFVRSRQYNPPGFGASWLLLFTK